MNFVITGNFEAKMLHFGQATAQVGTTLTDAAFGAAKEWIEEIKDQISEKFSEYMMEGFEEREKAEHEKEFQKEHEKMGKEQILPGTMGEHGHSGEGAEEGKGEGEASKEKEGLKGSEISFGGLPHSALSSASPNSTAFFRVMENKSDKSVSVAYDPREDPLGIHQPLLANSNDWNDRKKLYETVMRAKLGLGGGMLMGAFSEIAAMAEAGSGGEGNSEGGSEGGSEESGEATLQSNDIIFVNRALQRAVSYAIANSVGKLDSEINKTGREAIEKLMARYGFR
jgi:hypothetical protein